MNLLICLSLVLLSGNEPESRRRAQWLCAVCAALADLSRASRTLVGSPGWQRPGRSARSPAGIQKKVGTGTASVLNRHAYMPNYYMRWFSVSFTSISCGVGRGRTV